MIALRSGRKVASYTEVAKNPKTTKSPKNPKTPKAKDKNSTGVTKPGSSNAGGKKDGTKAPSARERAQAARKAKAEAKEQQQQQQQKEKENADKNKKKKKDAGQTKKPTQNTRNNRRRKTSSNTNSRNVSISSSTLSSISDIGLATLEASINHDRDNRILNFWLKPHLQIYNPTKPKSKDALSPHSAGVQKQPVKKWGRYALPPFGKPFWQKSRKDGRLELLLPMLVTDEEKEAVEERWFEGMKGRIERNWDEEDRRGDGGADDEDDSRDGEESGNGDIVEGSESRIDGNETGSESANDGDEKGGEGGSQKDNGNNNGERLETGDDNGKGHGTRFDREWTVSSEEEDEDDDESDDEKQEGELPIAQLHIENPRVDHSRKDVTSPDSSDSEQPPYSVDYPNPYRRAMPPQIEPKSYDVVETAPEFDDLSDDSDMSDNAFVRSYHGYEDGWVGIQILGSGSEGRVGLWAKFDSDGEVTNEICIKQKKNFNNDPKLRKPMEAKILEDLRDRANNGSIRLLGYRRYPKIMAHRLYTECCTHGDLYRLIKRYRSKNQYLPENFIWDVFHHLVNAVKAMDAGPSKPKYPEFTTYVHRDMKPDNIFLAAPQGYDEDGIPVYPTAKLGDFGFATITGEDDQRHNPHNLKYFGTAGYRAPEQQLTFDLRHLFSLNETNWREKNDYIPKGVTSEWPLLGTHTNIWGVGACIYELIVLTPVVFDMRKAATEGGVLGKIKTHRIPEYSKALMDLVHQCLKIDPARRPTLQELETKVESRRTSFRARWARGENVPEEAALHLHSDEFDRMDFGPFIVGEHVPFDWENNTFKSE